MMEKCIITYNITHKDGKTAVWIFDFVPPEGISVDIYCVMAQVARVFAEAGYDGAFRIKKVG